MTPARPDLAALFLKDRVAAARYVAGEASRVVAPSAPLHREPRLDAPIDTEALAGEAVTIYERHEGFAWVQLAADGYVGYLAEAALLAAAPAPTHRLNVQRSFLYPGPSIKLPPMAHLSLGAGLCLKAGKGPFAEIATGGFVWRAHLAPFGHAERDFVSVAERFLGVPYLWGGKTSLGLDCSGLVQVALAECGISAPRDSDMQQDALGTPVVITPGIVGLRRGDLVFWNGHVGVMRDAATLLHATGHHMMVVSEPLAETAARIQANGSGHIAAIKRLVDGPAG